MRFCENFVLLSESGTSYTAIVYENRSAMFELINFRNANIKIPVRIRIRDVKMWLYQ